MASCGGGCHIIILMYFMFYIQQLLIKNDDMAGNSFLILSLISQCYT